MNVPAGDRETRYQELKTENDGDTLRAELAECRRALSELQRKHDRLKLQTDERTAKLQTANEELQKRTDKLIAANRQLQASRQQEQQRAEELQAVMEAMPAAVFITHDRTASEMRGNRATRELLRLPPGANILKSAPEEEQPATFRAMKEGKEIPPEQLPVQVAAASGTEVRGYEFSLEYTDGSVRHLLGNAVPLPGGGAVGAFIEITEHKRAEEALRQSEERFRAVLDNSLDAAYRRDLAADCYDYISPAIETITGFSPDRFARMSIRSVMARIHPDDRKTVRSHLRAWSRTGWLTLEYRFRAKDGHYVWLGDYATLVRDEAGRPRYRVGIVRDVTQRKEAEQERERLLAETQAARAEAEKANRAKDQFIALVSHELRNPLNAIQAGVALLQKIIRDDERSVRTLEIIERNASLQARLVNDLLDFSRLQRGMLALQWVLLDVGRLVKSACCAYEEAAAQAGLTLTCKTPPGLWVQGDPDRLQQVVMNLLTNAVKFTPAGGRIGVEMWEYRSTGEAESGAPNPGSVRINITDTGIGMEQAMLEHLFEAFRQGEAGPGRTGGLGLGLALVKGLVERHGGRVWAESEGPGKGSRFTVELPLAAEHPGTAQCDRA